MYMYMYVHVPSEHKDLNNNLHRNAMLMLCAQMHIINMYMYIVYTHQCILFASC